MERAKLETSVQQALANVKSGKRILVVGAHPDDGEWMAGGTLFRLSASKAKITFLIVTNGSKGSSNPKITPKIVAATRRKEQKEASKFLGAESPIFLDHEDGSLESILAVRKEITAVIRKVRPEIVFTFDPMTHLLNHSDHRVTGQAALDAVYPCARDVLHYPEQIKRGLKPHKVQEVFLFHTDMPNTMVDISKYIDQKVDLIAKHKSQVKDYKEMKNEVYSAARKSSARPGAGFAEVFRHIRMPI